MSGVFRRSAKREEATHGEDGGWTNSYTAGVTALGNQTVVAGDSQYVAEQGGNDAPLAYQEAAGAPVETHSPLGYSVGPITIIFLNISKMIGTGIFSTPSSVLTGTGSVGTSLLFWILGYIISLSSLSVYLEYAAYFPSRSGSEVAYLEQAYPRPKWFFPTAFAVQSVLLSFSSSNAVVMAKYLFAIADYTATPWEQKGLAVGCYTIAVLFVLFNTRASYIISNTIGVVKVLTLVFISILGLVVLGGHTRVEHPNTNFHNLFDGNISPWGVTNALYRIIFSYAGYENAFNVVNEVKNPVKSIRNNGFGALTIVAVLYMLCNIAFFAAISKEDLESGKVIAASYLFTNVFGETHAVRGLNFLIALSSFGNLIAVLLGSSRMLRECGRQGVLPFPKIWAGTKPFGTPTGPYLIKWFTTIIVILAVPSGDAFNFMADLATYPSSVFTFFMAMGIYILRWKRRDLGLPRPTFKAWDVSVIFNIFIQVYLLVMPWYPPNGGANGGDVSFWYGTYIVVSIGILLMCGLYYYVYIKVLPKWKKYELRQEVIQLGDGAQTHHLVKIPYGDVDEWDRTHDVYGVRYGQESGFSSEEKVNVGVSVEAKGLEF